MSERMRIASAICAIAVIGVVAFTGLRALASGSGESMSESGLVVPSQPEGSAAQSDSGAQVPTPSAEPDPTAPAPEQPAPAPTAPYRVAPSQPYRATSDDDDDHDHDRDDDDDKGAPPDGGAPTHLPAHTSRYPMPRTVSKRSLPIF